MIETFTPQNDPPPTAEEMAAFERDEETAAIEAAEYRGLILDGLTGDIQSDRDVEIILKRVRWHRRRIKDVESRLAIEIAAVREKAETEIAELTENAEGVIKDNRGSLAFYERVYFPKLRSWLTAFLKEINTDKRSVKTIFGRIGLVAPGKPKTVIEDQAKALAWCEKHCPDAVKREVLTSKIPDVKVVPGIVQVTGEERFEVETN